MEQWSELKAVEFLQPANDNTGTVSVLLVLNVVYRLRVAHCGLCLCFHPPTMREQEKKTQHKLVSDLNMSWCLRFTGEVVLLL